MPKVLITGAAGFIGMHSTIRFLNEGWDVVGLDNLNDYYSIQLKKDRIKRIKQYIEKIDSSFNFICSDLNSTVWASLEIYDFDAIVHLAAQAGVRYSLENPHTYLESNVLGFQRVLDFVKKTKTKRFVYASSSSVYGKDSKQPFEENESCNSPESYYAATKKMNELMAKSYSHTHSISSVGLRFFTVYGPWGRPDMAPMLFADAIFNNKTVKVFNYGDQKRDFTYVDDIVEGILSVILSSRFPNGAEVYNIGNGSPVGLLEFIRLIEKASESELRKDFVEAQKGDVSETFADISKIHQLTGYKPKTDINQGIDSFIQWYKEYYNTRE